VYIKSIFIKKHCGALSSQVRKRKLEKMKKHSMVGKNQETMKTNLKIINEKNIEFAPSSHNWLNGLALISKILLVEA